jgi:hypothetical protein
VGVVDVQPRAVGEDDVGEAQLVVGLAGGVVGRADVEAARVAQRVLLLEVPARPAVARGPVGHAARPAVDDLRRGHHRAARGLPGTETPYSVSMPITRRVVMDRA